MSLILLDEGSIELSLSIKMFSLKRYIITPNLLLNINVSLIYSQSIIDTTEIIIIIDSTRIITSSSAAPPYHLCAPSGSPKTGALFSSASE